MLYLQNEDAVQFHTRNTAIALGKFDGIHLGHQMLVKGLLEEKKKGRQALVFTFGSNPNAVLKGIIQKNIYTAEEKAYYFEQLGVDVVLEYPFTKDFYSLMPDEFVKRCLVDQLGVSCVYVGEDYRFGKGRQGNVALLELLGKQYGFEVHAITKKSMHGKVIGSTLIRDLLESNFALANEMLGNPYFAYGQVVHGKHLGHTIGFPTINQAIPDSKIIPNLGVYASRVIIDGKSYKAITNLGKKPTVGNMHPVGMETHIIEFSGDLYGKYIQTELLHFIRPEMKFESVEKLKEQIQIDLSFI